MTKVAAIQMVSGVDLADNLKQAAVLIEQAAKQGAELAVLPENFALFQTSAMLAAGRDEVENRRVQVFLQEQASRHRIWLVGGSTPCAARPDGYLLEERVRSSCWVVDSEGDLRGRYDKIHLFDVDVADGHGQYRESAVFEPGDEILALDTPWGRLGVAICYDLRFPELFRRLQEQDVDLLALPAAFTRVTGAAHWHVLLRARAIENQFYVIAANQGGRHGATRETFGHSLVVDPRGQVLAEWPEGAGVVVAELDYEALQEIRRRMPVRQHRRIF